MAKSPTILQERVAARLAELRRSPRSVSLSAGLGPDAIRTILTGRSRSPRGDTLVALADELQCDVGYLIGAIDTPYESEALRRNDRGTMRGIDKMLVHGQIRHAWRPVEEAQKAEWKSSDIFSLPDYLPGYQNLWKVEDGSADLIAHPGAYLHVLGLGGGAGAVADKDVLVISQQRLAEGGAGEIRTMCWEVRRYRADLVVLRAPTTIRAYQEEITLEGRNVMVLEGEPMVISGQTITPEGLVLRAISPLTGPSVERA